MEIVRTNHFRLKKYLGVLFDRGRHSSLGGCFAYNQFHAIKPFLLDQYVIILVFINYYITYFFIMYVFYFLWHFVCQILPFFMKCGRRIQRGRTPPGVPTGVPLREPESRGGGGGGGMALRFFESTARDLRP